MGLDSGTTLKSASNDSPVTLFDSGDEHFHGVIIYNYGDKAAFVSADDFAMSTYVGPAAHDSGGVAIPAVAVLDFSRHPTRGVVKAKNATAGQNFTGLFAVARL